MVVHGTKAMVKTRLPVEFHFLFLKSNHAFALLDRTLERRNSRWQGFLKAGGLCRRRPSLTCGKASAFQWAQAPPNNGSTGGNRSSNEGNEATDALKRQSASFRRIRVCALGHHLRRRRESRPEYLITTMPSLLPFAAAAKGLHRIKPDDRPSEQLRCGYQLPATFGRDRA
jgi:hypothetical protein